MGLTATSTLIWAREILRQLGAPADCTLEVLVPDVSAEPEVPYGEAAFTSRLEIQGGEADGPWVADQPNCLGVVLAFDDAFSTSVLLEDFLDETESVVLVAEQFQDSVLEHTGGVPAPPCPGHSHPAVAGVMWHGILDLPTERQPARPGRERQNAPHQCPSRACPTDGVTPGSPLEKPNDATDELS
ncbi:hypothetical protein KQY30_31890 [Streptomyces sp. GMY02]|uniref:hypothetical protein n=1 Tax=Streptomyces sp. GMY02 TaxID=1333528 RepID=UPI001C2C49B1|nr:hypothetical protein [Streptomyces sp. GMY02]QXE38150.1 hypothetical protein KQY30_31890 [Streptomyces sp. GMY02]